MMRARLAVAALALLAPGALLAESADYYRGGWRTADGQPRVYQFVIRGDAVTGYFCTHCADATTLAPLEGSFSEDGGIRFTIRHLNLDGSARGQESWSARLEGGKLVLTGDGSRHLAIKDPRGPTPGPYVQTALPPGAPQPPVLPAPPGGPGSRSPAYVQPAPWRQLTADDVVGVWLGFGTGMDKQFFLIRKDGDRLFGLACGRCDNPYTHGALQNFRISGDRLEFDIVHQDWGEGTRLPFDRHVTATIAMNEMRVDARREDIPGGAPIVASLVGPISLEATRGNVVEDVPAP